MLSNPVYGPSIHGNLEEVFPADKRWTDPGRSEAVMVATQACHSARKWR